MPRIKKPRVFPCQWTKADKDKLRVNAFRNTGLQETFFGAISGLCSPRGNIRIQEHVRRRIAAVFFCFYDGRKDTFIGISADGQTHYSGFPPYRTPEKWGIVTSMREEVPHVRKGGRA